MGEEEVGVVIVVVMYGGMDWVGEGGTRVTHYHCHPVWRDEVSDNKVRAQCHHCHHWEVSLSHVEVLLLHVEGWVRGEGEVPSLLYGGRRGG